MKHISKVMILIAVLALLLSACQPAAATQAPAAEEKPAAPEGKKVVKAALILPGVASDAGWNAAAYSGLMAAKEQLGAEVAYSESVQLADFEATFRDYASQGYDVVIGHGSEFGDAALAVAKEFPNTYFAVTNSNVKAANVAGLDTKNEETGYMAGFIAGTVTKTKTVAYVGAMEIVAMKRAEEGFKLGVAAACPDCQVLVSWIGSFDDVAKGKENGLAMIDKGADVLDAAADAASLGVLDAAKDRGVYGISGGGSTDLLAAYPKTVLATTLQHLDPLIVQIVKEVQDGTFQPNTVRVHGYDTGVYELGPLNMTIITQEQADKILAVEEQLKAGKISLPHLSD